MTSFPLPILFLALVASCAAPSAKENPEVSTTDARPELPAAAHDFDFWVGDWSCMNPDGTLGGTNHITLDYSGRVLQEHWQGSGGGRGTSVNIWDQVTGLWHQTWVDQSGTLLQLDGGLDDEGRMVMTGTRPRRDGQGEVLHQIMWTPAEDGSVHQVWTYSADGGATWNVAADLVYVRK